MAPDLEALPEPVVAQLAAFAAAAPRPVVLVDGGSGAGKSQLADRLAPRLGAQLVRLDDIYPGWDGLAAASEHVRTCVLRQASPGWRAWDWHLSRPGAWHAVDPSRPLLIEGCGSLSAANRGLATFAVWMALDEPERRARALRRDGETYAPHWQRWADQERDFAAREHPEALADAIVDVRAGRLVIA